MLAQSFMSAADLGITEAQRDALQKVLVLLETDKLTHIRLESASFQDPSEVFTGHFSMVDWNQPHECGTVCCIAGTAELVGGLPSYSWPNVHGLNDLFIPYLAEASLADITPAQAARALRSYLTTGDAKWAEAVAA